MNFFQKITSKFSVRGRALAQVHQGMDCAKKNESVSAINHYTSVVNSPESPRDVKAMARFNRALVYTTIGKDRLATEDLKAVLNMPEAITKIKKSASDKLVRMQRKLTRDESSKAPSEPSSHEKDEKQR